MVIETKHFGEIEVNEDRIITFSDGIPGFDDFKKYIIIKNPQEGVPFNWLQSTDNMDLAFVIINPFIFKQDYEFNMPENVIKKLDIKTPEDVTIYSIVTIPDDINKMTANLVAPIVINHSNKKGKQILLQDSDYNRKHLIINEIKNSVDEKNSKKEQKETSAEEVL